MPRKARNPREYAADILAGIEQLITDIESVHDNRPDVGPIDYEDLRIMRAKLTTAIERWDNGDRPADLFDDATSYAERLASEIDGDGWSPETEGGD